MELFYRLLGTCGFSRQPSHLRGLGSSSSQGLIMLLPGGPQLLQLIPCCLQISDLAAVIVKLGCKMLVFSALSSYLIPKGFVLVSEVVEVQQHGAVFHRRTVPPIQLQRHLQ